MRSAVEESKSKVTQLGMLETVVREVATLYRIISELLKVLFCV